MSLTIKDLSASTALDQTAMTAMRGGMLVGPPLFVQALPEPAQRLWFELFPPPPPSNLL